MRLVIDTNVLMAGLIRESTVREILLSGKTEFFMPEEAIEEVKKYAAELCAKAGYSEGELETILSTLLEHVTLIRKKQLRAFMKRAEDIMKAIDIKDAPFLAACFSVRADGIWSFDTHFLKQNVVRVFDMHELAGLL